jgi:TonB family protein
MNPLNKKTILMKKDNIHKIFSLKSVFAIVTLSMVAVLFACELREVEPNKTQEELELMEAIDNTTAQMPVVGDVFFVVEEMPEFPKGEFEKGEEALRHYIATEVKYPKLAQEAGASGRVYVSFVVADDGTVRGTKIARSSGFSSLDEEAIRVVSAMPKWRPGKQQGKCVNVSYTVPINFLLNGESKSTTSKVYNAGFDDGITKEGKAQLIKDFREKGWTITQNDDFSVDMTKIATSVGAGNSSKSQKEIYNKDGWLVKVDANASLTIKATGKNMKYEELPQDLKDIVIEYYRQQGWVASFNANGSLDMKKVSTAN